MQCNTKQSQPICFANKNRSFDFLNLRKCKVPRIAKTMLKKKIKARGLILTSVLSYKVTVISTHGFGISTDT